MALPSGSGYFISPSNGAGPGVLLVHSFRGLNRHTKDAANDLSDAGFTVLAPDLSDGQTFDDDADALEYLAASDMNVTAALVQASIGVLRRASADPAAPIAVVGFGSGASWALWLSARRSEDIAKVVTYYGAQTTGMDNSQASYLCHWAENDEHVSDFEVAELGLNLQLADAPFEFVHHEGVAAGFAEAHHPNFDEDSSQAAWAKTLAFLAE